MQVLIVSNPIAGGGQARRHATALAALLVSRDHEVTHISSEPRDATNWLAEPMQEVDVVAVVGGDGTVRSVALTVAAAGVPLVHVPQGNENLFARTLGMGGTLEDTVELIEHGDRGEVDDAIANGHAMLLMASVGLDAHIVAGVAAMRQARVSHWHYVRAAMRCCGSQPPRLSVRVDGELVVPGQRGWLVVSNAANYGAGINPAPMASMHDGVLDMTFFRASSALEVGAWMLRCRLGRHRSAAGFVHRRASREVLIEYTDPAPWQLDGDPPPSGPSDPDRLTITLSNRPLSVLRPTK
jgi:diacylglycerol kinase family enzyme